MKQMLKNKSSINQIFAKNIRWIIFTISLICFILLLICVVNKQIYEFDNKIYNFISVIISPLITIILKIITTLGSAYVIIPTCIISIIYFWKKKESKYIAINLSLIFIINQIIKRIIQRPRPNILRIVEETGYSFPSAHSMVSMAFYGFFIYLIYKKVKNNYIKWSSIICISLAIIIIGFSRIYLGVHYASDVLAGFCLSICYLSIFTKVIKE